MKQTFKQFLIEELPDRIEKTHISTKEEAQVFTELASQQRGSPEQAMLQFQKASGGGILDSMVEHGGDLIHRMTNRAEFGQYGYTEVKEKVERLSDQLNGKPLEEIKQNIRNNAQYMEKDVTEHKDQLMELLGKYAREHEQLPTYNYMHFLANQVAFNIGMLELDRAETFVQLIKNRLKDVETYKEQASTIYKNKETDQIVQFRPEYRD